MMPHSTPHGDNLPTNDTENPHITIHQTLESIQKHLSLDKVTNTSNSDAQHGSSSANRTIAPQLLIQVMEDGDSAHHAYTPAALASPWHIETFHPEPQDSQGLVPTRQEPNAANGQVHYVGSQDISHLQRTTRTHKRRRGNDEHPQRNTFVHASIQSHPSQSEQPDPSLFARGSQQPHTDDPVEANAVEANPVQVDPVQVDPVQVDPVQVDPVQVDPVQVDLAQVDPVQVDPVQVDPVQVDPVQVDPVQVDPVQVDPVQVDPVQVGPIQVDPVQGNGGLSGSPSISRRHQCSQCLDVSFDRREDLNRHYKSMHAVDIDGNPATVLECRYRGCGWTTVRKDKIKEHEAKLNIPSHRNGRPNLNSDSTPIDQSLRPTSTIIQAPQELLRIPTEATEYLLHGLEDTDSEGEMSASHPVWQSINHLTSWKQARERKAIEILEMISSLQVVQGFFEQKIYQGYKHQKDADMISERLIGLNTRLASIKTALTRVREGVVPALTEPSLRY